MPSQSHLSSSVRGCSKRPLGLLEYSSSNTKKIKISDEKALPVAQGVGSPPAYRTNPDSRSNPDNPEPIGNKTLPPPYGIIPAIIQQDEKHTPLNLDGLMKPIMDCFNSMLTQYGWQNESLCAESLPTLETLVNTVINMINNKSKGTEVNRLMNKLVNLAVLHGFCNDESFTHAFVLKRQDFTDKSFYSRVSMVCVRSQSQNWFILGCGSSAQIMVNNCEFEPPTTAASSTFSMPKYLNNNPTITLKLGEDEKAVFTIQSAGGNNVVPDTNTANQIVTDTRSQVLSILNTIKNKQNIDEDEKDIVTQMHEIIMTQQPIE